MNNLGKACSLLRRGRGYTQVQASIALGVSPETVSAFENGRTNNAKVLCWYLGLIRSWEEFYRFMGDITNG